MNNHEDNKDLQSKYELAIQSTVKEVSSQNIPVVGGQLLIQKNMNEIISQYNIDTTKLVNEAQEIMDQTPYITDIDLKIQLLKKVAGNKKFKRMSKLAQEMLQEKWWEKND